MNNGFLTSWIGAGLLLCVAMLGGCQSSRQQAEAQHALESELHDRQQRRAQAQDLYHRGLSLYEQADLDEAQQLLQQAVQIDERHASAWMALGVVEFERHRLFDAAHAFDKVTTLRPSRYEPHFNLGQVFESIGRYPKAIEAYEKALELAPGRVEVMENLARCYIATGQNLGETQRLVDRALVLERRPEWRVWLRQQARELEQWQVTDIQGAAR